MVCYGRVRPEGRFARGNDMTDKEKILQEVEKLMENYIKSEQSYPKHPAYYDALVDIQIAIKRINKHG